MSPGLRWVIPNAWIDHLQCSDWQFPMLGLTIPNAGILDPSRQLGVGRRVLE